MPDPFVDFEGMELAPWRVCRIEDPIMDDATGQRGIRPWARDSIYKFIGTWIEANEARGIDHRHIEQAIRMYTASSDISLEGAVDDGEFTQRLIEKEQLVVMTFEEN